MTKQLIVILITTLSACSAVKQAPKTATTQPKPEAVNTSTSAQPERTYGERPGLYECGNYYADLSSIKITRVGEGWRLKLHDLRTGRDITMEQGMGRCRWIAEKFDEAFMKKQWFFWADQTKEGVTDCIAITPACSWSDTTTDIR